MFGSSETSPHTSKKMIPAPPSASPPSSLKPPSSHHRQVRVPSPSRSRIPVAASILDSKVSILNRDAALPTTPQPGASSHPLEGGGCSSHTESERSNPAGVASSISPQCGPVRSFNLQVSTDQLGFSASKDKAQSPTQFKIGSRLTSSVAPPERGSSTKSVLTGVSSTQQPLRPRSAARQTADASRPLSAARPAERRVASSKPTSLLHQFASSATVVEKKRPVSAAPAVTAIPTRSSSASRISSTSGLRSSVQGSLQGIPEQKEKVRPMSATRRPQPTSPHTNAFR